MLRDISIVLRSLARQPGFALAVILTLGLGLGANAALFSLVDAVMLRPLAYPQPEELVSLVSTVRRDERVEQRSLSYPDFVSLRDGVPAFESAAAMTGSTAVLTSGERAQLLRGSWVTEDYFSLLGVEAAMGPGFSADDGVGEVVLADALWRQSFGADPEILDRSLTINGEPYRVVGVMPAGFGGVEEDRELWRRLEILEPENFVRDDRFLDAIARLAPGVSVELANEQLATVFGRLEQDFPEENTGYGAEASGLREAMVGDLEQPVTLLLAAVGLLLLIACANVANLLLVRRVRQRRQVAIRYALGAARRHVLRWRVAEALALGVLGGGLGLLLATWGTSALVGLSPVELPAFAAVTVNGSVAAFALALALAVGAALGLSTALRGRGDSPALLRQGASTESAAEGGARRWLLATEVALALVVSVGALAALVSWREMVRIDPGFEPQAAVFRVLVPAIGDDEAPATQNPAREAIRRQVQQSAASIPGVATAALASDAPLQGGYSATVVSAEGAVPRPDEPYGGGVRTYRHVVSEEYFDALRLPILRGRGLEGVTYDATPVALVSRRLAERLWPGVDDPIGRRFKIGSPPSQDELDEIAANPSQSPWMELVGIVGEARHRTLVPDAERVAEDPDLYLPLQQWPRRSLVGIVRTQDGIASSTALATLRERLEELHAEMPVYQLGTLEENFDRQTARSRFGSVLMALFAGLSLTLAAIGIYGVMTYRVSARAREIGIRIALGADRRRVIRRVLHDGLGTAALGLAAGCAVALAASRWLPVEGLLYGTDPASPLILLSAALALAAVAALACTLPALRASRVDPTVALREE